MATSIFENCICYNSTEFSHYATINHSAVPPALRLKQLDDSFRIGCPCHAFFIIYKVNSNGLFVNIYRDVRNIPYEFGPEHDDPFNSVSIFYPKLYIVDITAFALHSPEDVRKYKILHNFDVYDDKTEDRNETFFDHSCFQDYGPTSYHVELKLIPVENLPRLTIKTESLFTSFQSDSSNSQVVIQSISKRLKITTSWQHLEILSPYFQRLHQSGMDESCSNRITVDEPDSLVSWVFEYFHPRIIKHDEHTKFPSKIEEIIGLFRIAERYEMNLMKIWVLAGLHPSACSPINVFLRLIKELHDSVFIDPMINNYLLKLLKRRMKYPEDHDSFLGCVQDLDYSIMTAITAFWAQEY